MKNKSLFSQIILLILIAAVCVIVTVGAALFAGSDHATLFDFQNLNIANMIPVLIIGCFISCVIVGIGALFAARSVFIKIKDYISGENGGERK